MFPTILIMYHLEGQSTIIPMEAGDYLVLIAPDGQSGYCGNSYQGV